MEGVFGDVAFEDNEWDLANSLKKNAVEFSANKANYYSKILKDKTLEERNSVIATYERHLKVESDFATRGARSAKQWQSFEESKEDYPNLEYLPSRSAEKRADHQKYYGVVKPIDDPFWDSHLPPNGWNCKCRVRKSDKEASEGEPKATIMPSGVVGNNGKEKKLFSDHHTFIKNVSIKGKKDVRKFIEQQKRAIPFGPIDYKSKIGGTVNVHPYADLGKDNENYINAKRVVDEFGIDLEILPITSNVITGYGKNGFSNPEYRDVKKDQVGDLKSYDLGDDLEKTLETVKNQGCSFAVFHFRNNDYYERLVSHLNGLDNDLESIYIIHQEGVKKYK